MATLLTWTAIESIDPFNHVLCFWLINHPFFTWLHMIFTPLPLCENECGYLGLFVSSLPTLDLPIFTTFVVNFCVISSTCVVF